MEQVNKDDYYYKLMNEKADTIGEFTGDFTTGYTETRKYRQTGKLFGKIETKIEVGSTHTKKHIS